MADRPTPTARPVPARPRLGLAALAGAACLLLSEVVETVERLRGDGLTAVSYLTTIAGFLGLAGAAVVVQRQQHRRSGRVGAAGAALFTVGSVLLALGDVVGFGAPDQAALQAAAGPVLPTGVVLLAVGGLLFGSSVVRAGVFPAWTGVVIAIAPLFLPATRLGFPEAGISVTNSVLAVTVMVMGAVVRRRS